MFLSLLVANAHGKHARTGVCYTRNQVRYDMNKAHYGTEATQWMQVSASVRSLRTFNPSIATCLFTEAPHRVVNHVLSNGSLFDVVETQPVLDDVLESMGLADQWRRLRELVLRRAGRADSLLDLMSSRLKRIHNYGRAPFDATLYVDDDTVFCPDRDLAARLRGFTGADVRFVEMGLSKPLRSRLSVEQDRLGRCGDNWTCAYASHQGCEWFQNSTNGPLLQGGAVLVTRGQNAKAFARAWIVEYLDLWTNAVASATNLTHMRVGTDQKPLDRIVRRACDDPDASPFQAGALPPNFNARFLAEKWTGLVAGPVVVLHSHAYGTWGELRDFFRRIGALCATLNAHSRPRFISMNGSLTGHTSYHDLTAAVRLEDARSL